MSEAILSSPGYRPRQHGGYPRVGSSSLYFADGSKMPGARIDGRVRASRMMGGGDQGPIATRGLTMRGGPTPLEQAATRQQNIATSRADGTFDAKRNAFNAANKGSYMDEAGQIGPKASSANASQDSKPTQFTSVPDGQGGSKMVKVPPTTAPATSKPIAPAGTTVENDKSGRPVSVAPRQSGIAAVDAVTSAPAPRPPATFEGGKSRAEWFGAATQRQGVNNAYSGDAVAEAQKASAKPAAPASPTVAAKPTPTPAVPTAKTATAMPSLGHSPEAIDKAIADAGKQTGVQPRTMAGPAAPAPAAYTGGDNPPVPRSAQEDDKNKPGRLFSQNRTR